MDDDGVDLVPLHHSDVKETSVFAVHRVMDHATLAVAVILRRLHEAYGGIREARYEIPEPIGVYDIVGVDYADDLGIRRRMIECKAQRRGLEAGQLVGADELETVAEYPAMLFDRLPKGGVGRVVDDDHTFVGRIVQS